VLLQEVHHRVKNNLQVISSILNLQSSYVDDPKTLEILRESQQRIKSMSFIHETIYRTADFSRLEFMDYIKTIASNLIQSYRTAGVLVDFKTEMESVGLNLDQAIPCGLIINELVSNALKYAFKGRKKGVLTIVLREENNEVYIAVKDDGVGLPKDFAYEKNNSLGIQLVYALLDQLDATVNINQSNGTEFLIHFQRKQ
jgi:two-component sensor histidine kinase